VGRTVADALVAAGLDPTSGMRTDPPVDALLEPDMEITATDVFIRVAEQEVATPFDVVIVGDPKAPTGSRKVVTAGAIGRRLRIYQVLVVGGVEGPRFLKAEKELASPVAQVVSLGTKREFRQLLASRGSARSAPAPTPAIKGTTRSMRSTSYSPWDSTCSGHISTIRNKMRKYHIPAGWGLIAVDPRVIPMGTKVYVEGYGYAIAGDTGGVIKGDKIDVCFWGADSNASYSFSDGNAKAVSAARKAARAAAHRWMTDWGGKRVSVTILGR
jgi:3D (Asp-Asp-Asp) domain-containing protein